MQLKPNITGESVTRVVKKIVLRDARAEAKAEGRRFDPKAAAVADRVDLAVAMALDDLGLIDLPE